ncbi:MAG: chemotaxis protein [Oscillospiraceae bacterium]|jgi:two-component system chemotaxis response regulator CheV|nr:chemotaxis protein [Oscillospiraceae bacterium]
MNSIKQSEILLESGTNELEIMEFTLNDELFGINVAKVREILQYTDVKPMQNAHPVIEGIFKPRDSVITVLDLAKYLGLPPNSNNERDIFIITHFNNMQFAFHVHSVVGINRISWTSIQKPDQIIYGGDEGVATGIAEFEGRLITILDFEKIIMEIRPQAGIQIEEVDSLKPHDRSGKTILIAEDSMMLAKLLLESLHRAGYNNVIKTDNGQEAWDVLNNIKGSGGDIKSQISCVVTDIEMPQMDGHRLTKLIKEDSVLRELPVVLFSSLINEEMRIKGRQLGADAQITKPEIGRLVMIIDDLIDGKKVPEA